VAVGVPEIVAPPVAGLGAAMVNPAGSAPCSVMVAAGKPVVATV